MKSDTSPLLLGIDTGGTFTDSVLLDVSQNRIISKSKSPTTHRNLIVGIRESIEGLGTEDFGRVTMVGLSTTLATNAIVERTGRPVGLVVVGYDGEIKTFTYFEEVLTAADQVLIDVGFDGTDGYLGPKNKQRKDLAAYALWLYSIIDDYNNSELCTGEPSH